MSINEITSCNYQLTVLSDIDEDILCSICQRIMVNASFGSCGCQYCKDCIMEALSESNASCPGLYNECNGIRSKEHIFPDIRARKKIGRLKINCPNLFCKLEMELKNFEEHIKDCRELTTIYKCPYSDLGCNEKPLTAQELKSHLENGSLEHSMLLVSSIADMKEQIMRLNAKVFHCSCFENDISESDRKYASSIDMSEDIMTCNDNYAIRQNAKEWISQCSEKRLTEKTIQNEEYEAISASCDTLDNDLEELESPEEETNDEDCDGLKCTVSSVSTKSIGKTDSQNNHVSEKRIASDKVPKEAIQKYAGKMFLSMDTKKLVRNSKDENISVPFTWTIDKVLQRKKNKSPETESLFSESFYRHGYKMCLRVNLNGVHSGKNTHLSVYFIVMHGMYDDYVRWPLKYKVQLYLVDRTTNADCHTREYYIDKTPDEWKHCFGKPKTERNAAYGHHQFILWRDLMKQSQILKDNCLVIGCKMIN